MPLTTHCQNCGRPKSPDLFASYHCELCINSLAEADQYIAAEGIADMGQRSQIRQEALLRQRQHPMHTRTDPRSPFPRIDTASFDQRTTIEPGSPNDPRRTR